MFIAYSMQQVKQSALTPFLVLDVIQSELINKKKNISFDGDHWMEEKTYYRCVASIVLASQWFVRIGLYNLTDWEKIKRWKRRRSLKKKKSIKVGHQVFTMSRAYNTPSTTKQTITYFFFVSFVSLLFVFSFDVFQIDLISNYYFLLNQSIHPSIHSTPSVFLCSFVDGKQQSSNGVTNDNCYRILFLMISTHNLLYFVSFMICYHGHKCDGAFNLEENIIQWKKCNEYSWIIIYSNIMTMHTTVVNVHVIYSFHNFFHFFFFSCSMFPFLASISYFSYFFNFITFHIGSSHLIIIVSNSWHSRQTEFKKKRSLIPNPIGEISIHVFKWNRIEWKFKFKFSFVFLFEFERINEARERENEKPEYVFFFSSLYRIRDAITLSS